MAPSTGKQRNCKKGYSCGSSCIAKDRVCQNTIASDTAKKGVEVLKNGMKKGKGKKPKQTEEQDQTNPSSTPEPTKPEQTQQADSGDFTASLKEKKYNPNAIEDLDIEGFRKYQQDKEQLASFDSKDNPANQTLEQYRESTGNPRATSAQHKAEILKAINEGMPVSDEILSSAGVKLNKKQQTQLESNREDVRQKRENVDRVQKAIDHPLVTEEDTKGFKPKMSDEESRAYTKDSFFGDLTVYHGNSSKVAEDIADNGAKPEKNTRGLFGQGVYFGVGEGVGDSYAGWAAKSKDEDVSIIGSRVKMKRPYVTTMEEISKIGGNFAGDQANGIDSKALTDFLRAKGHDGVYLKDSGYLVAFDQKQVVTHQVKRIPKGTSEFEAIKGKTYADNKLEFDATLATKAGSRLAKLNNSETRKYQVIAEDDGFGLDDF